MYILSTVTQRFFLRTVKLMMLPHPTHPLRKTDLTEARNKIKGAKKDTYTSKEVLGAFREPGHSKSLTPL